MGAERLTIDINLGIDFGTSFTKVCYRDVNREETGVVSFAHVAREAHIIPSVLRVSSAGRLAMGWAPPPSENAVEIPFLKMRLEGAGKFKELPHVDGIDLNSVKATRALCAWFLSLVISHAKHAVKHQEAARVRGREIRWSANVGVPVEHYDGGELSIFEEVLQVAWSWDARRCIPFHLKEALERYGQALKNPVVSDCHAYPEIVAAVHSFVMSRSAAPGMYLYFDIGGGTLDGVAFNFRHVDGMPKVECYSGKVANLGVQALSYRVSPSNPAGMTQVLLRNTVNSTHKEELAVVERDLHKLVGYVVMQAKRKDPRDWIRKPGESLDRIKRSNFEAANSSIEPLPVFVGGGAWISAWYRDTLQGTHRVFKHRDCGIPPYTLRQLPLPKDRITSSWPAVAFEQFAVAYGLAVPAGEGPDFSLPGAHDYAPPPDPYRPLGVTPYWDTV